MKYEVVPIGLKYRGVGRSLSPTDFNSPAAKKNFDFLVEEYYKYISISLQPESKEKFDRLVVYYKSLLEFDISCELIVFDVCPLVTAYGHPIEFLGIDLANDFSESLLEFGHRKLPSAILNDNMLLTHESDAIKAIPLCNHGGYTWLPCWVYKVIC